MRDLTRTQLISAILRASDIEVEILTETILRATTTYPALIDLLGKAQLIDDVEIITLPKSKSFVVKLAEH